MKVINWCIIVLLSVMLSGCATNSVKKDQLMLNVPKELLVEPAPLIEL
jgi:outer membrane murein-binding lipoprotein Lpp